jgi:hypothetical protein
MRSRANQRRVRLLKQSQNRALAVVDHAGDRRRPQVRQAKRQMWVWLLKKLSKNPLPRRPLMGPGKRK